MVGEIRLHRDDLDIRLSMRDKGETKGDREGQKGTGSTHGDRHTEPGRRKACVVWLAG